MSFSNSDERHKFIYLKGIEKQNRGIDKLKIYICGARPQNLLTLIYCQCYSYFFFSQKMVANNFSLYIYNYLEIDIHMYMNQVLYFLQLILLCFTIKPS